MAPNDSPKPLQQNFQNFHDLFTTGTGRKHATAESTQTEHKAARKRL
jgi:hypothetical protein